MNNSGESSVVPDPRIGDTVGYICGECADKNGGVWPENHVATFHGGECDLCGESGFLACWDDWNWPNDPRKNRIARSQREL